MAHSIIEFINNFVLNHTSWVYFFAFTFALLEGVVILSVLPGTTLILIFGTFAVSGKVDIYYLVPLVVLGAFIGDNIGYVLGRYAHKIIEKSGMIDNVYYDLSKEFIKKHGGKSIFFARFVSILKESAPFTAGVMEMNRLRFSIYNFLGALGWATMIFSLSYIVGEIKSILDFMKIIGTLGVLGFVSLISLFYIKNKDLIKNK